MRRRSRGRFVVAGFGFLLLLLSGTLCPAAAQNILWFTGHSGHDEGHEDYVGRMTDQGYTVEVLETSPLPDLSLYFLVILSLPGFSDPTDFFTVDEKSRLYDWLTMEGNRLVVVGDWYPYYQGGDVMNDLLAALGSPIMFVPGAWDLDPNCFHCDGEMGEPHPLTEGLDHICYGSTSTWDPAYGVPLAYPEDPLAPGPLLVATEDGGVCVLGIADASMISDECGHIATGDGSGDPLPDPETVQLITERVNGWICPGEPPPSPVEKATWGKIKAIHR